MTSASSDIKAETQLVLAIEEGLQTDEFMVCCKDRFRREYSKDIVSAEQKEVAGLQYILNILLSRNGFYDLLPEGLFFQSPKRSSNTSSAADMALDYKQNRKREDQIRNFFIPFENEFFFHRLKIEKEEMLLLEGLQSGILNEYFIKFWELPTNIPKRFIAPFLLLLPYAHKISGNFLLTSQSLALILGEKVSIKTVYADFIEIENVKPSIVGESLLGQDLVCGNSFWDGNPVIEIEIGPLAHSSVASYLEGGNRNSLMETFMRFFIPAGIDTKITLEVAKSGQGMVLAKGSEPVLGYSTFLV